MLSALKADADLRDIPVVMVTVAPERGIGLSLGAVEVLTKPVDRARLTALIHRLVRRDGPVLVVEDDTDTRDMMRHSIEKMGIAVAETANGRLALSWLGDNPPPATILLDLMMPEMDGFAFLDALAGRAEWREIPVIVVTAKQLTAGERERLLQQARERSVCAPACGARMFRRKTSAGRAYLQIVESRRDGDQVRQQVIATLGRFEDLQARPAGTAGALGCALCGQGHGAERGQQ
jgi:CheY-like chemotaxis protein